VRETFNEDSETGRQHKEFLSDMLMGMGLKTKSAAGKINISAERLYKYLNESAGNNNLPSYLVPIVTTMISPAYLEWLCAEAGYSATKLPEGEMDIVDAIRLGGMAMEDCGKVLSTYSKAIEDGRISSKEEADVKRSVRYAIKSLLAIQEITSKMRKRVESSSYRNIDRY
jgi:hypothetical protein